ncbi:MAG: polysaccharide biosynthesis/export family protein [Desulfovibrionaceae bacterium]
MQKNIRLYCMWSSVLLLFCLVQVSAAWAESVPFGSNLFQGNFAKGTEPAPAASAVLGAGDRLVLRLWGGITFDDTVTVDSAGEITLPQVGTFSVAGLSADKVAEALRSKLAATTSSAEAVQVYVAPLDSRPVTVFVTGGVQKPGRYTGAPTDSLLTFLDKAGGIQPQRGSYRQIRLMRKGQEVANYDLYPFLRRGSLPANRIQEGDTLVVGEKGPSVLATGAVRNAALFEFRKHEATGSALMDLADPESKASHVTLKGTRQNAPYTTYIPMQDFRTLKLEDGDTVQFMADASGNTMMIEVQGAVRGASRFPVRRGARLSDVQNYIAVEQGRAQIDAIYIKRKSVAARQKKALSDSLRRLEEASLTATSGSTEEAQIRSKEAEMVAKFVERAKSVEPEGVVVLDKSGKLSDLTLEDGDIIVIPEKSDVVVVSGEVMVPQATVWNKKKDLDDYVKSAGGYSTRADKGNALIMRQNGSVARSNDDVYPGDQILVLPKVESKSMQAVKDIAQVLFQVAVSSRMVLGLP